MGKFRRIRPDPNLVKQVDEILSQQRLILESNSALLKSIMHPPIMLDEGDPINLEELRPGRILR